MVLNLSNLFIFNCVFIFRSSEEENSHPTFEHLEQQQQQQHLLQQQLLLQQDQQQQQQLHLQDQQQQLQNTNSMNYN